MSLWDGIGNAYVTGGQMNRSVCKSRTVLFFNILNFTLCNRLHERCCF